MFYIFDVIYVYSSEIGQKRAILISGVMLSGNALINLLLGDAKDKLIKVDSILY